MTISLSLTPNQEARLRVLAVERGIEESRLLAEIFDEALSGKGCSVMIGQRDWGLRALGIRYLSDDFTDPLPDAFWLGEE